MKQFFKMFFASLLAMIVAGVIVLGVIIGLIVSAVSKSVTTEREIRVAESSILVIDLKDEFHEQGRTNSLAAFSDGDNYEAGLYDAAKAIQDAAKDDNIKGIFIKLQPTQNGWASMQQLRAAILDFKKSNKFVYAYGEDISQGAYYLGAAADSIYLNPIGELELKGFATVLAFFKGTLDKLEIEPEIFYAGKFKSATEPFRSDKMSEPNRAQISEFISDFWNEFLVAAAAHAGTDTATVHNWAATGAIRFPQDAVDRKLVDRLLYWDEVEDRMRARTGAKKDEKLEYISLNEYAEHNRKKSQSGDSRVAVLFAEGQIVNEGNNNDNYQIAADDIVKVIRKLRKSDKIKAVVLRVNSPGGSALASEIILRELQLLKKEKPLIVSMGDLAASGGYYIACQADSIFAMPNTITGSIGVFSLMFNVHDLMKNKLGVTFDAVKNTEYADFPNGVRTLTENERARMQAQVDNIYTIFKSRVAAGRSMGIEAVDSIAQGRVWTGTDAKAIGLVDGLGDLDRAITSAARKANIKDYKVVTYPEPVDKLELLIKRLNGADVTEATIKMALERQSGEYNIIKQIKQLKSINGQVMTVMPHTISIN